MSDEARRRRSAARVRGNRVGVRVKPTRIEFRGVACLDEAESFRRTRTH